MEIETAEKHNFTDKPRGNFVISPKDSYLELNFDVKNAADETVLAVGSGIRLVD